MSSFVDTIVLVRHLTGDPPDVAARATSYLRDEVELLVVDLIVAETVYVLESVYEAPRRDVASAMRSLLALESVVVIDAPLLIRSIDVYENEGVDFAEAYLVACAESTNGGRVASFDTSIDRITSVHRIEA